MKLCLLLLPRLAMPADSPTLSHTPQNQKKVYGRTPEKNEIPSPGETALKFKKDDDVYYYSKHEIRMFDTIANPLKDAEEDDSPIDIPDFISKKDLDSILNILEDDPIIDTMGPETLARTLRTADYLGITEKDDERTYLLDFFTRVCRHSILSTHKDDILNSKLYNLQPKLARGCLTYTHLALSLVNIFGLQAKVLEEGKDDPVRALVFHEPSHEYGKILGFRARIDKIKITHIAQNKIIKDDQIDPLDIIIWLFVHTGATWLDMSGCSVDMRIITKIADLEFLEVLNLSRCTLPPNPLVPIGNSRTLQEVLCRLYADNNKLSANDTKALALLAALQVLSLSDCELPQDSLVAIGESFTLRVILCELNLSYNKHLGINDTKALASLAALRVLSLSYCELPQNSFVPIGNSPTLREVLYELDLSYNILSPEDIEAICPLAILQVLNLSCCDLQLGFLVPIGDSLTLRGTLRILNLTDNANLGSENVGAVALLTALQILNLSGCELPPGSLVPIRNNSTLKGVLQELDLSYNTRLSPEDMSTVALLTALNVLRLRSCELLLNSFVPIGESSTLRGILHELDLSDNEGLGLGDMEAIALLTALKILNLSGCELPSHSLVPICSSKALQATLHLLDLSKNEHFSLEDMKALALLTALGVLRLKGCELPPGSLAPIYDSLIVSGILRELDVTGIKDLDSENEEIITKSRHFITVIPWL